MPGYAPADKAVKPLRAGQAEELERGVSFEELRVWNRAARGLEVEPALGCCHFALASGISL